MPDDIILKVSDLSFCYKRSSLILEDINFTVSRGDYVTLIGPNGGGKTTLVKVILGLLKGGKGHVWLNRKYVKDKRDIGYVPQLMLFDMGFPVLVQDVVLMGLLYNKSRGIFYSKKSKRFAEEALDRIGMLEYKKSSINELSGGQIQRVLIARAMVSHPKLLILDEPTNFVDEGLKSSFCQLLRDWQKDITILLITHDLGVVSSFANKILCINRRVYVHEDYRESFKSLQEIYGSEASLVSHHLLDRHP